MPNLLQELRFSVRVLTRNPGFSVTVVAILALGLGTTTSMFTVVDNVLLRPLPYSEPGRIVTVSSKYEGGPDFAVTRGAQYRFLQERSLDLDSLAAYDVVLSGANLADGGEPVRVDTASVSSEFFRVLGVSPVFGKAFSRADDRPGNPCVLILTDEFLRKRYVSNAARIGRAVALNGESCTIFGILPATFRFDLRAEIFRPVRIPAVPRDLGHYYRVLGRLKPHVQLRQAQAELQTLFSAFKAEHPDLVDDGEVGFIASSYLDRLVGDVRPGLWMLSGTVCLLLLIACANVANLLLVHLAGRSREMAIRSALGAGRLDLLRQLLAQNILLGLAGGLCGLLLARLGVPALLHLTPSGLPRASDISVDGRVAGFAIIASALTALLFSALPVISGSLVDVNVRLKGATGWATAETASSRRRRLLIAGETTLSVVLLTGAVLLIHSFTALRRVPVGFDSSKVLTFKMSLPARYSDTAVMWRYERSVIQRLDSVPGVAAAASALCLPLETGPYMPASILGRSQRQILNPAYRTISPDYFRVLRISVMAGRPFLNSDGHSTLPVAIINEAMAKAAFQNRSPIGEHIRLGAGLGTEYVDSRRMIVGVVGDVRETSLDQSALPTVFIPRAQIPDALNKAMNRELPMSWAVRTTIAPAQVAGPIRRTLLSVDSSQALSGTRTMEEIASIALDRQRFTLVLMAIFAGLTLLIASTGIYGIAAYQIRQREREFGIRLALGATSGSLRRFIAGQELKPILLGLAGGVLAATILVRFIGSLLFETSARDPFILASSALFVLALALLSSYLPAARASLADPVQALRHE